MIVLAASASLAGAPRLAHAGGGDGPLLSTVGSISDIYGTFQAAEFVAGLFGIGKSPSFDAAVQEIHDYLQQYRNRDFATDVETDLRQFQYLSSLPAGPTQDSVIAFNNKCIADYTAIQNEITAGTMDTKYFLAPAFNLLAATMVGAMKAFGQLDPTFATADSTINFYIDQTFGTNYQLVGGLAVDYDLYCPSASGLCWHFSMQNGKAMWPKYAPTNWNDGYGVLTYWPQQRRNDWIGYDYDCDMTQACNVVDSRMACCQTWEDCNASGQFCPPDPYKMTQSGLLGHGQAALSTMQSSFMADPAVSAVFAGLWGTIFNVAGHNEVMDYLPDAVGFFPVGIGHMFF
jgi:hypothetical protein